MADVNAALSPAVVEPSERVSGGSIGNHTREPGSASGALGNQRLRKAKCRTLSRDVERRRRKAVKAALDHFRSSMPGSFKGRKWALDKIKADKRPMAEAKRLVEWFRTQDIAFEDGGIDFSDVQELRAKIVRRDGLLDSCHAMLLGRMERMIADGGLEGDEFKRLAAAALAMKSPLPKSARQAEAA